MMVKTKVIVLKCIKYGDSKVIVDLLTEKVGRQSFICHVSNSPRSRFKKQFFQPLSILSIEFDHRPNLRLQSFKYVNIAYPFQSIPFNPYKLSLSLFVAEFLTYAVVAEDADSMLFEYVESSLKWLDVEERQFANFHLVFMMRLTKFLGFYPNLVDYRYGDFFDMRNAIFTSTLPDHNEVVAADEASKINLFMRMSYETMHLFSLSRKERNRCVELILSYYRFHVPNFPPMKSLPVLSELFV